MITNTEMTNVIFPCRIVAAGGDLKQTECLLSKQVLQIGLAEPRLSEFGEKSYVIFDFGREIAGGARILTYAASGDRKIRLRFGESVSEVCAELGEDNATNDHSLRDFTLELANWSDMSFGNTGFRFLRLDVQEGSTFQIKSVVAVPQIDEREQVGSFECDDELVNKIWNTAAYTLRLCIQNGYLWDGIKRDRLVWIGDLSCEMHAIYCLYGNLPEVRNSLDFAQREGIPPAWINNIPMYSLWWLIELADEYAHTGDGEYVLGKLSYVRQLLATVSEFVNEEGDTLFTENFIDWPMHYLDGDSEEKRQDELAGVNYLMRIAMIKTGTLLRALGEDDSLCRSILQRLEKKQVAVNKYKQAGALGVFAGDRNPHTLEVLKADGAERLSTFLAYYIFSALARFGEYNFTLNTMKEYYGGMLNLGATTFFEDFDVINARNAFRIDELPVEGKVDFHRTFGKHCYKGFRHSLCHGWSCGVIPYLAETVLGVKEKGVNTYEIDAHLSGLKHVKGNYPTSKGLMTLEYTVESDGSVRTQVNAPQGVTILSVRAEK